MTVVTIKAMQKGKISEDKIKLPEKWEDLSPTEAREALQLLISHNTNTDYGRGRGLVKFLQKMLSKSISKKKILALKPHQVNDIISHLSWMKLAPTISPIVPTFRHGPRRYQFISPGMKDATCREVGMHEDIFRKHQNENTKETLLQLTACMCNVTKNRVRKKHLSLKSVNDLAQQLKLVPSDIQLNALLYASGCTIRLREIYGDYIYTEPVEGEEEDANDDNKPLFGWWTIFMQVAASGTFGNFEQVLETNFHTVAMWLVEKERERRRQERSMEQLKMQNQT